MQTGPGPENEWLGAPLITGDDGVRGNQRKRQCQIVMVRTLADFPNRMMENSG